MKRSNRLSRCSSNLLGFFLFLLFLAPPAKAVQELIVKIPNTPVVAQPSDAAQTLVAFPRGVRLKGSNATKDGYYKVLLPKPVGNAKFGWIKAASVVAASGDSGSTRAKRAGNARIENRKWRLFAYGGAGMYSMEDIIALTGDEAGSKLGIRFGGELTYAWKPRLRIGLMVDYLNFNRTFPLTVGENGYSIKGLNVLGMLHYQIVPSLPFRIWLSLGGGVAFGQNMIIESVLASPQLSRVTATLFSPIFDGRLSAEYVFSSLLSMHLRVGYRMAFTNIVSLSDSQLGLGDDAKAQVSLGGIQAEIGPSFSF